MRLDDRDIICEQDYSPLSNAELVEAIERYAAIMSNAPLIDFDLEWITGPARALLARAEAAEARAANEALAELAASETERRVALAERVAELEAQLERKEQLLNIAIDRLPEEEQEIVALRWALSGPFTNELPTMPAPAAQEPTP